MEFRERLKELRVDRGWTQQKLGSALDYGSSAIANYESGRNQPSIQDLIKIATLFEVSTDYLIGISDAPHPYFPLSPAGLDCMSEALAKEFCGNEMLFAELFRPILQDLLSGNSILVKD